MGYHLGIDLGTTYSAAAVERAGRVGTITLGNRHAAVPSVLFLKADGEVLVGDAANRRGATEPERLAREFKRRVGDPTPVLLGGAPYGTEALMGKLLRWVVDRATEGEGGPPDAVALTHPANWGAYKLDLLQQAARHAGVTVARYLTEPEAAATSYASQERVPPGSVIAVYDLGGGTFDATVLRKRDDGFDILGQPEGIERLGGIDFDVAVFNHVWGSLGTALSGLDVDDPAVVVALGRLRRECVEAKEALSSDTDVSIPVALPTLQTEVRLTRSELESMIRPALAETVVALHRTLQSAGVGPEQVSAVLLVGGSSRIPLVSQLLAGELGRPIAVDANPKDAICMGAAIAAAQSQGAATPESVSPVPAAVRPAPTSVAPPAAPATEPPPPTPAPTPASSGSKVGLVAALVGLVALLGAAAFFLLGPDDDPDDAASAGTTTTTGVEAVGPTTTTTPPSTTTTDPYEAIGPGFVQQCVDAEEADPEGLRGAEASGFCQCSFDAIRSTFSFAEFVDLNDEVDRTGVAPPEIDAAVDPCVQQFS